MVKIDVCKLISLTNAQTLDEHRRTREKLKGDEVLCMTNLVVPTIHLVPGDQRPGRLEDIIQVNETQYNLLQKKYC